ncbi:MAG: hypothetical protein GOV00_00200 [Candidatus Altiarchaeota archaeon]|nr:hypothetical protein [Candidatus Altiarchaeota archaeon]
MVKKRIISEALISPAVTVMRNALKHSRFVSQEELQTIASACRFDASIVSRGNHYLLYLGKNEAYDPLFGIMVPVRDSELLNVVGDEYIAKLTDLEENPTLKHLYVNSGASMNPVQMEVSKFNELLPNYDLTDSANRLTIQQNNAIDCGLYCLAIHEYLSP